MCIRVRRGVDVTLTLGDTSTADDVISGGGNINLTADKITSDGGKVNSGAGLITLNVNSPKVDIDLGETGFANSIFQNMISSAGLTIGSESNEGTITVTDPSGRGVGVKVTFSLLSDTDIITNATIISPISISFQ